MIYLDEMERLQRMIRNNHEFQDYLMRCIDRLHREPPETIRAELTEISHLRSKLHIAVKALEFYDDTTDYLGRTAREALKQIRGEHHAET